MKDPDWRKMMLTLVAIVAGLVMLISALLMLRYRPPRKDQAARLYKKFVKKTGLELTVGETPLSFAARAQAASQVPAQVVTAVTQAYLDARYGAADARALERLKLEIETL